MELGRLLTLEDELRTAWSEIPRSPEDAISRLRSIREMMDQIEQQRELLGTAEILEGIAEGHRKTFLKMLYAKTELRRTRGKEQLVKSLRKRAGKLQTVLGKYNLARNSFLRAFPDRPAPASTNYDDLLEMAPDDPFWNDGILTNHNEPWAMDSSTQAGMRDIARLSRAEEEVRRIGREVRRLVRWTICEHKQILALMVGIRHDPDWVTPRIETILADPILDSLVDEDQLGVIKGILHSAFVNIASLQLTWEKDVCNILNQTGPYQEDEQLKNDWNDQVTRLAFFQQSGFLSMVDGDFDNAFGDSWQSMDQETMRYFLEATVTDGHLLDDDESEGSEEEFERALEEEDLNSAVADSLRQNST
ncbi:hypothetical protein PGTUg99_031965 [Puccinia graminis f. sp. tritici]|uniref:Uncharacterized protein n=1 Tax=Puccinia graminis f. sp. tritici TaxID=56615 RepID=A0A5B0SM57_PUCGR|nr:hypothetical protein PGTUg99_031965 [Puccinia graminis f. sp. tritici]